MSDTIMPTGREGRKHSALKKVTNFKNKVRKGRGMGTYEENIKSLANNFFQIVRSLGFLKKKKIQAS